MEQNTAVTVETPKLTQPTVRANETATHYGYVVFSDVDLGAVPRIFVQPPTSPYFTKQPARALIPFVNISLPVSNPAADVNPITLQPTAAPTLMKERTAANCAFTMQHEFGDWGYRVLTPLTGLSEADADQVFRTIQPFKYSLKDAETELMNAPARIMQQGEYQVTYKGHTLTMRPLPAHLIEVAMETYPIMVAAARTAVDLAEQVISNTIQSLTNFYAGQGGKRVADPLDQRLFNEFEREIPQLVTSQDQQSSLKELVAGFTTAVEKISPQQPSGTDIGQLIAALEEKHSLELEALKAEFSEQLLEVLGSKEEAAETPKSKKE